MDVGDAISCLGLTLNKYQSRHRFRTSKAETLLGGVGHGLRGDTEVYTPLLDHCLRLLHAVSDIELQRELVTLSKEAYQLILVTHRFIAVDEEGRST